MKLLKRIFQNKWLMVVFLLIIVICLLPIIFSFTLNNESVNLWLTISAIVGVVLGCFIGCILKCKKVKYTGQRFPGMLE